MHPQFLEAKQDYQLHLEGWQERQKFHRAAVPTHTSHKPGIRTYLVYPADFLILLGLRLKRYATGKSGWASAEISRGFDSLKV